MGSSIEQKFWFKKNIMDKIVTDGSNISPEKMKEMRTFALEQKKKNRKITDRELRRLFKKKFNVIVVPNKNDLTAVKNAEQRKNLL